MSDEAREPINWGRLIPLLMPPWGCLIVLALLGVGIAAVTLPAELLRLTRRAAKPMAEQPVAQPATAKPPADDATAAGPAEVGGFVAGYYGAKFAKGVALGAAAEWAVSREKRRKAKEEGK